jgi:hypothetical protein
VNPNEPSQEVAKKFGSANANVDAKEKEQRVKMKGETAK